MVYKFEEFKNLDMNTIGFIDGSIDEKQFLDYLNHELINENILVDIKQIFTNFKEKVVDIFYSFLVKAYEIGFMIFDKLNTFIKWLTSKINKFKDRHPTLYKIIIITMVVMILMMITAASAKAATSGTPIPKAKIDMAIGWLDQIKSEGKGGDTLTLNKAIAHLIDLRDGKIDMPNLGQSAIKTADAALNTCQKIMADAQSKQDQSFYKFCVDLIEKGQSYVQAIYSKTDSGESIKLLVK